MALVSVFLLFFFLMTWDVAVGGEFGVSYLIIYMSFECRLSPPLRQVAALAPVLLCVFVAGAFQLKAEDTLSQVTTCLLSTSDVIRRLRLQHATGIRNNQFLAQHTYKH
jgi:hypothetical protein